MSANPDDETLALLRRRDPRGFDQAYARYGARLFSFLCRLAGRERRQLAEDLLQQTFLALAERGAELRPGSDLRAWLFTVARNAFLGHVRGMRLESGGPSLELVADYGPDAEARLLLGDVEEALGRLRLEDRELLLLIGVEGLEPISVSRMLGLEPATLRKRLARARGRLLEELSRSPSANAKERAS
jgi:RNA polymerase sigma-70 factor, ECF subfamily